ncbi:MAG: bifunctional folylpolyglutamate synthase/dihydrofolate synthase [Patescibacteria group bacterium]|nr:bifunctional folylpolyglutamate synthase/dihydrofolate synthase [Patescibacteria group bacterium]
MNKNFDRYYQAVEYLESISNLPQPDYFKVKSGRSLFLDRFAFFLKLLGNPQRGQKYIQVGGTSGKGSVATMIQSILTEAKFKTGLYLSPHPTTTIERIKIGNLYIAPGEFADIIEALKPAIDKAYQISPYGRPSYFEILTAVAFIYFKKKRCDYVVLEVGLGGRFDATNIISKAAVTIINTIGFDHTDILGNTLEKIAGEKAAIIKPRTKFFTTAKNTAGVRKIFEQACKRHGVTMRIISTPKTPYQLKLLGHHQQTNAALAAAAAESLGINPKKIKAGLSKVEMSCRLEIIHKKPLLILDGAHNESKILSLAKFIGNLTYQKLYLIMALTRDRNPSQVFKKILPLADHITITRYRSSERKCYPPKDLADKLKTNKPIEIFLDSDMALNKVLAKAKLDDIIVVAGSFYLAGELRKRWRSETKILNERKS